jgi:hypothetical protein
MSLKETDITASFSTIVSHIKDKVRNNVVLATKKSKIKGLSVDDRTLAQLCNLIETTIEEAATEAIGPESRGLFNKIKK